MTLDELKQQRRWVLWRLEQTKDGKPTKRPYQIDGHLAACNTPSTWSTFAECEEVFRRGGYSGIGMVLGGGPGLTPIVGVDGDACCDEDKKFSPESRELVITLNSYAEYSPSEHGFHCWVIADLGERKGLQKPYPGCKQVEVKGAGYYHTFTGRHLSKTPHEVLPRQAEIDALYAKLSGNAAGGIKVTVSPDEEARFKKLWAGDTSEYDGDHSRADLALCSILARRCRNDIFKMDEQFRESGLYRDKWERSDYASQTLLRAVQGNTIAIEPSGALNEDSPADWIIEPLMGLEDGWFPSGELSLIGGPSGAGKTHLLIHILTHLGDEQFGHRSKRREFAILLHDRGRAALRRTCRAAKLPPETLERVMDSAVQLSSTQKKNTPGEILEAAILSRPEAQIWVVEGLDLWTPKLHDMESVGAVLDQIIAVAGQHRKAVIGTVGSPKQKENDRYASGRDQFMGSVAFGRKSETCISLTRTSDPSVRKIMVMTRNTADEYFYFMWDRGVFTLTTEPVEQSSMERPDSALYRMGLNVFHACKPGEVITYNPSFGSYSTFERWRKMATDMGKVVKTGKVWYRAHAD